MYRWKWFKVVLFTVKVKIGLRAEAVYCISFYDFTVVQVTKPFFRNTVLPPYLLIQYLLFTATPQKI
jgi:hypothetical protein